MTTKEVIAWLLDHAETHGGFQRNGDSEVNSCCYCYGEWQGDDRKRWNRNQDEHTPTCPYVAALAAAPALLADAAVVLTTVEAEALRGQLRGGVLVEGTPLRSAIVKLWEVAE